MTSAGHEQRKGFRRRGIAVIAITLALGTTSCVVDTPPVDSTQTENAQTQAEPTAFPAFEPTAPPPPPPPTTAPTTAPPEPTATALPPAAEPTPTPTPTPTDRGPAVPEPLPTAAPDSQFESTIVQPGLIAIPVASTTFVLAESRPILQLGGHTLIYVDENQQAEVDIFTPVAVDDGTPLESYDAVIEHLLTDPLFAELEERNAVTIAGRQTRVFEGTGPQQVRAFITDLFAVDNDDLGWVPPVRMRLWVIDDERATIIVSAESLQDPGQYPDAVRLATEVLSTIDFG